jgi:glycosyltransferase involved in cell wall biosynthesis
MKKRILFVAGQVKDRSPAQRFRFEQYLDYFQENGYDCELAHLLTAQEARVFYSKGNTLAKTWITVKSSFRRYRQCLKRNSYDIIFIQREAFSTGTVFFEKMLRHSQAKLLFDFDDAIWLQSVSDMNKRFSFLKNPGKTETLVKMADFVIAGNAYLAEYALRYNPNVAIIPTTIDTNEYQPHKVNGENQNKIVIGWSGSFSTIAHFKLAVPALIQIKKKYGNKVQIKVIGDGSYKEDILDLMSFDWDKANELTQLNSFDIGIMPLPDDEWSKGKCGLKGLQYMALEIPTIMSPVGVNGEIISDGVNGFTAASDDEWVDKLERLIEHENLRQSLGKLGRKTVIEKYSVTSQKKAYINIFNRLLSQ